MSRHELCLFGTMAKQMVFSAADVQPGDSIKAQQRRAERNLNLGHTDVWRAWQGRVGWRAFPKIEAAYHKWIDRRIAEQLQGLSDRLDLMGEDKTLVSGMAGKSPARYAIRSRRHSRPHRISPHPRNR